MPYALESSLKRQYADLSEKEQGHAVYGTLNKLGYMKGSKETAKGRAYDKRHKNKVQTDALSR